MSPTTINDSFGGQFTTKTKFQPPACKDCEFFGSRRPYLPPVCTHAEARVMEPFDLVYGQREYQEACECMREPDAPCGPGGALFRKPAVTGVPAWDTVPRWSEIFSKWR